MIYNQLSALLLLLALTFAAGCAARGPQPPVAQHGVSNANTQSPEEHGHVSLERWKSCGKLIHPEGTDSVAELQAMFERPENVQQLLRNLKLASDREWYLQPSFFDDATLRKFFNVSMVKWETPDTRFGAAYVVVELGARIDSDVFPKMTVRIESSCTIYERPDRNESASQDVSFTGHINLDVGSTSDMTLRLVRREFGHEDTNNIDDGIDQHGRPYIPTMKGSVLYFNAPRIKLEGPVIGTEFYFRLDPRAKHEPSREILDNDVVTTIRMGDTQHRILETQ